MMKRTIKSFDGTEKINGYIERPEKYVDLFKIINTSDECIARGAGLSYCASSAGNDITSIDFTKFDRILEFDEINGIIRVEAGITIGCFLQIIIQKGWNFKVIPGYPSLTIGGCVAFNVHGKSQFNIGKFGDHIKSLTLYHPAYGELICSDKLNKDVFDLTLGGFGLTGIILDVTLGLTPLNGNSITRNKINCTNLSDSVEKMILNKAEYESVYSWNNLNFKGKNFGKGIIYLEKYMNSSLPVHLYNYNRLDSDKRGKLTIGILNKLTVDLMCILYYSKELILPSSTIMNITESAFPIYGKELYYHFFGKQGFREYQLIVPEIKASNFFYDLQKLIEKFRIPVALGSLKLFQGEKKHLNFCQDGVCLAIDVPADTKSIIFFSKIDELVIKNDGIANLSKDSRLPSKAISMMYNQFEVFKTELLRFDPKRHFNSSLRKRIEV
jgi:decaprenylphospho-beta-D-ribofuranose 2-oxidase